MEKNLGHATAYGYAKSKGYSGTEDEFAELMADYASVGQSAAQSAEQAAASATSASASAQTASQAAQTATSKASEAVTAAGTATTKASEASQSASTASSAATSAGTSAQTATMAAATATTKASEAAASEAAALSAKTDAETARDAAAQSASEAAASAESIDPDEFNRKIYAAFVTDTASGSIASFADGADSIPMKDVLVHIEPVQEGSGDPSPDNVRPITGWTGAKVTRTGKNLLDANGFVGGVLDANGILSTQNVTINSKGDGKVDWTSTITWRGVTSGYIEVRGGHAYRLSLAETPSYVLYAWYAKDKSFISRNTHGGDKFVSVTAPDGAMYLRITIQQSVDGTFSYNNIQLELGSTATDYEPYSGQTYSITFPSEAGTVYGGTLDVTKGELVVDRAQIASYNGEALPSTWISDRDVYASGTTPTIGAQVVYKLASPITYSLTPQEITSLLGTNNVWADTGDSDVEYRADTALYISRLTEPDADMIADSNITSGQYFMVGNNLYRATSNIASGASVIVGTNAVKVSLATALNEINQ